MNLYISKAFYGSRMNEKFVTEKYHFIARELMRKIKVDMEWHDWYQLKIARRIYIYHPVQVPSLNTPDYFQMNLENSWMVNYGSKIAQEGRELR